MYISMIRSCSGLAICYMFMIRVYINDTPLLGEQIYGTRLSSMLYAICKCIYIDDPISSACSHHYNEITKAPEPCFDSREHECLSTLAPVEGDFDKCMFASTCNAAVNRSVRKCQVVRCDAVRCHVCVFVLIFSSSCLNMFLKTHNETLLGLRILKA